MRLLALDTSSNACSVAILAGSEIHEDHVVGPREHTRILMPMISRLLADGGIRLGDLDAIALGNGPGSFIGMRIGASVAQGLAFGAGLRIAPVSSLAAVAAEVMDGGVESPVVVAQDARMNEVYCGGFERGDDGLVVPFREETIVAGDSVLEVGKRFVAAGDGWNRYPALANANAGQILEKSDVVHPRARWLLPIARAQVLAGETVAPDALQPAYLRTRVAEVPAGRSGPGAQ